MTPTTRLSCACGQVHLEVEREPIISAECCCNSCREAAARMERLPGAGPVLEENGTTRFVMYRKDRIRFVDGVDRLKAFRLTPRSTTRRVVASCCNTPVFLEFKGGHWLSLYRHIWPAGTLPPNELRTMTSDLPAGSVLPDDVPNARRQTLRFYAKLFGAWAAMGFRSPKIAFVNGEIDA
jgi:hypothetical protein